MDPDSPTVQAREVPLSVGRLPQAQPYRRLLRSLKLNAPLSPPDEPEWLYGDWYLALLAYQCWLVECTCNWNIPHYH